MRIRWEFVEDHATMTLALDSEEVLSGTGQGGRDVSLIANTASYRLPILASEPTGDLLALAAVVAVAPWVGNRIAFDRPVSPAFADALESLFGWRATPVDTTLTPRSGIQVGLAYSGGADSVACSMLVPDQSPHIHLSRVQHPRIPNRATHVNTKLQASLVARAADRGKRVAVVDSDVEFMVGPYPMYATWLTLAAPVVLLADELDLGGVAFGTVLGSRYLSNGARYRPANARDPWSSLFTAVGLPFVRPAAGLTEVGTQMVAALSPLADLARSCALGTASSPCYSCGKCLRKDLVLAALGSRGLNSKLEENIVPGHRVFDEFQQPPPFYFHHIVEYGLSRLEGVDRTFLRPAWEAMGRPSPELTDWANRFYPPALENDVPAQFRDEVASRVAQVIPFMTADDVAEVENWDAKLRLPAASI